MTAEFRATLGAQRFTHLDSLRAALMMMGIIIHAGFVYISNQSWLIASDRVSVFFDYLVLSIHAFRLPAFFLLSGFLFALVLARSPTVAFFRARSRRLLIPLFSIGLALNLAQFGLFHALGPEAAASTINSQDCSSIGRIISGCWTIHLWFLVNLFYYFLIAWPLSRLLTKIRPITLPSPASFFWILSLMVLLAIAQVILSLYYRGFLDFINYLPLIHPGDRFLYYLPFFIMGVLLSASRNNLATWTRFSALSLALLIASWTALLWQFHPKTDSITLFLMDGRYVTWLFYAVAFQTTAFLVVLAAHCPRPSLKLSSYLSDCALTTYLFHHILVFIVAVLLVNTAIPIAIQFMIIVLSVSLACWGIHHYIVSQSRIARYLVNGRKQSKLEQMAIATEPPAEDAMQSSRQ